MTGFGIRVVAAAAVLASTAACSVEPRTDLRANVSSGSEGAGAATAWLPSRLAIRPEGASPLAAYSPGLRSGDLLWLSGQIGMIPGADPARLVDGGVEAEARQAFANMEAVLAAAGLGFGQLVKCTVFLADISEYAAVNAVYAGYFQGVDPPARSAVAVAGLPLGAKVEIECVAAFPPGM